ncbi:MAG TPA: galactokinase [Solirubrobacteraceae bacterium]
MTASRPVEAFAPGRVNLIGEHTDYNQGLALPFAIDRGITVTAEPIQARTIEVQALDLGQTDRFNLDSPQRIPGWPAFVRGTVAELSRAGVELIGARLTITGDIPRGAGLSSSAALEVALALALIALSDASAPDRIELARLCSRVENEWSGAQTGLLDQLSSLCGQPGHCLRIDFRTLEIRPVALELDEHRLVTLDSGSPRVNTSSGYNQRRAECSRACELLGLPSLREARLEMTQELPEPLGRRARHVIRSNARVDQAIAALERHDFPALGELLDESHASLREDYEISTPEVEDAVGALKAAGALGARIMGGGFGGHVLGLFGPGSTAPDGSLNVRPGPGARAYHQL